MKTSVFRIRALAFILAVTGVCTSVRSQFLNGDFEAGVPGCTAGPNWTISTVPDRPQLTNIGGNLWIDLTNCGSFGNGTWIEQTIGTVPGRWYRIQLDLGTWVGWQNWDTGVDILIDGNPLNAGSTRLFNDIRGLNPEWGTFQSCLFKATNTTTTVRIVGNGANPLTPGYVQPSPGPGVMGVDNVELIDLGQLAELSVSQNGCNYYCIDFIPLADTSVTISNIRWLIDGVHEATDEDPYCRFFPKDVPVEVMVVFSVTDACGTYEDSVSVIITAKDDCPCQLDKHVKIETTFIPCDTYEFNLLITAGYEAVFTQWTLDGQPVSGSLTELLLSGLDPGKHVICAMIMGGVDGEPDNLCCAKICTVIEVPDVKVDSLHREVVYCSLEHTYGPPVNPCDECSGYYEYWRDGMLIGTSADGCIPYYLNSTSEIRCYDIGPGGVRCLRSVITYTVIPRPIIHQQLPDDTAYVCGDSLAYNIGCPLATHYEIIGPGSFYQFGVISSLPVIVNLAPGTYTINCINVNQCRIRSRNVHIIAQPLIETRCDIFVQNCWLLRDEAYILSQIHCPECAQVAGSATYIGPWKFESIDPFVFGGLRIYTREYVDSVNCRKCVIRVSVPNGNFDSPPVSVSGNPCYTFSPNQLPQCMFNRPLKLVRNGMPGSEIDILPASPVTVCCRLPGPAVQTFILYAADDPCCYLVINLSCGANPEPPVSRDQMEQPGRTDISPALQLVPNPTSSVFRIVPETGADISYDKVEITDIRGKIVLTRSQVNSGTEIDMRAFEQGIYLVNITMPSGVVSLRLLNIKD